jgi:hypothetical protein
VKIRTCPASVLDEQRPDVAGYSLNGRAKSKKGLPPAMRETAEKPTAVRAAYRRAGSEGESGSPPSAGRRSFTRPRKPFRLQQVLERTVQRDRAVRKEVLGEQRTWRP